jgi:hypothetical protein
MYEGILKAKPDDSSVKKLYRFSKGDLGLPKLDPIIWELPALSVLPIDEPSVMVALGITKSSKIALSEQTNLTSTVIYAA